MNEKDVDFEETRFSMVKKRHKETFEKAVEERKTDKQMISLCRFIAKSKNYFTSSCCAGRILLLGLISGDKRDSYFHEKWHRTVKFPELWEGIERESKGELWFKMESFILHIGCRDLEKANKVLEAMRLAGVKRGGIIVAKEGKFLVEMVGTQGISVPVKKEKKIWVEKEFMEKVLEKANKKLEKNYAQIKRLEKAMKKRLE